MDPVVESLVTAVAPVTVVPPMVAAPDPDFQNPTTLEPLGNEATPAAVRLASGVPNCDAHCGVGAAA
jgi:hypothetical protein